MIVGSNPTDGTNFTGAIMPEYFCNLTPKELELLAIGSEECGEVVQIIGKILRHGLDSHHPDDVNKEHNSIHLIRELSHVVWISSKIMSILEKRNNIDSTKMMIDFFFEKENKAKKYLHHQN